MTKTSTERSPKRIEGYVEELKRALSEKGLTTGKPNDLVTVARALTPPGAVRADIASAIRSILSRDPVGLSRAEVATMLVVAVGGANLYAAGQEVEAIGQLDGFVDWVMSPLANVALDGDGVAQAVDPFWGIVDSGEVASAKSDALKEASAPIERDFEGDDDKYFPAAVFTMPRRSMAPWIAGACAGLLLVAGGLTWRHLASPRGEGAAYPTQTAASNTAADDPGSQMSSAASPGLNPMTPTQSAEGVAQKRSASDTESLRAGSTPVLSGGVAPTAVANGSTATAATTLTSGGSGSAVAPPASGQAPGPAAPSQVAGGTKPAGVASGHVAASTMPGGSFVVSSGVMSGHLLAAPQPSYPKMAKMWGIQGEVVLQAVVSRNGQVVTAHALDGHKLLRTAATNAVKKWRYRPYVKNGKPTDVDTVVIVNFKLPS